MSLQGVKVLEADPELGLRIPPAKLAAAREQLTTPILKLGRGVWPLPNAAAQRGSIGLLIVDGLLARDLVLAGKLCTELLSEGDIVQPAAGPRDEPLVQCHVSWHVLEPVCMAVLDDRFARILMEWPQVMSALLERAIRRSHRMAVHQAILQLSPVETRLLVLFWHLAERWGKVSPQGIVLPLGLSHQMLSQLVGCQRASVTTALKAIQESGAAQRRPDGTWVLCGSCPDELTQLHWARPEAATAQVSRRRPAGFGLDRAEAR